jgi:hypothetical protein
MRTHANLPVRRRSVVQRLDAIQTRQEEQAFTQKWQAELVPHTPSVVQIRAKSAKFS